MQIEHSTCGVAGFPIDASKPRSTTPSVQAPLPATGALYGLASRLGRIFQPPFAEQSGLLRAGARIEGAGVPMAALSGEAAAAASGPCFGQAVAKGMSGGISTA
jgi:hypothetical protein